MRHRTLIAGGNWDNGVNCGSRGRNANNYRWNTNSNIGCRFCADTGECAEIKSINSWLDALALPFQGKIHNGGAGRLVGKPKIFWPILNNEEAWQSL